MKTDRQWMAKSDTRQSFIGKKSGLLSKRMAIALVIPGYMVIAFGYNHCLYMVITVLLYAVFIYPL